MEIDLALMTDAPKESEKPVICDGDAAEPFSTRQCLRVIKSSIKEAIRGVIPNCETGKEYLKMYVSTIIKRLVTEKYSFGSEMREHILKMSNMTSKLKTMDMGLKDEFLVHLVMSSLPKEFEAFEINYNSQPEN
jgi:hypothetical protein